MAPPRLPSSRAIAIAAALALLASACGGGGKSKSALHVASPAWEDQVIYFVLTDRFSNGDPSNDDQHGGEFDPTDNDKYSGGDLQGVIDRLDYVQGLGATAVWITPPVANMWWDPLQQSAGYHGYWARNLTEVDAHQGSLETYKALSRALHGRGMYLVQDIVPNHMGNFFQYDATQWSEANPAGGYIPNTAATPTAKPTQPPFDQNDPRDPAQLAAAIYHFTPAIADYQSPTQETNWQVSDLDDLNSENPVVRKALRASYAYWIKEVGVDAFRVDTVKYVPHDFWNDFFHSTDPEAPGILAAAKATGRDDFFAFGEVYETPQEFDDAADRKVASFLGTPDKPELPAVIQFPLYAEMNRVFAEGKPTADLTYRLGRMMDPALFPNPARMPTFIDNHDVARFLSRGTADGLAQALTLVFTLPGIPVIYQGTEQAFTETRAAMFAGGFHADADKFDTTSAFYQRIQKLAQVRRSSKAFTRGDVHVLYDNPAGPGPFAYTRTYEGETVLVLMNTADEPVLVSGLATGLPDGTVLEVLHSERNAKAPEIGAGGRIQALLGTRSVLVARATATVTTPPTPPEAITVSTPLEGQTFTGDVQISGRVTPAGPAAIKLVVDGVLGSALNVPVGGDGTFRVTLPVSTLFGTGIEHHAVIFWDPVAKVASDRFSFTTDVVFQGQTYAFTDPVGDDAGPKGTYTYPTDPTFGHQMDLTGVTVEVGATTLNLKITTREMTTTWAPNYGFDHVAFNVYFSLPGRTDGATVLPARSTVKLNANAPAGFTWNLAQLSYGWENAMYTPNAASPEDYGPPTTAPAVHANAPAQTVTFTYDRTKYGLASWSGVKIYVATWDFDGINAYFRKLTPTGGPWDFGGGGPADPATGESPDPKIMDDIAVITIP